MADGGQGLQANVEIDGTALPSELIPLLEQILVVNDLHLPDMFCLTFRDLDRKVLDRASLKIGSKVKISATDLGGTQPVALMTGEVTAIEADYHPRGNRATVRGYDHSHRLSRGRKSDTYRNAKDSDIAGQIARKAGLAIGTIDDSGTVNEQVSQANLSDWDFIRARARKIGFEALVVDGAFHFRKPTESSDAPDGGDYSSSDPLQLVFGQDLLEFRPRVTASGQVSEVQVRGWDPSAKKVLVGSAKAATTSASLKAAPGDLADAFGSPVHVSVDRPTATADEAQKLASVIAEQISSAFAEADGVARGNPKLTAGSAVSISVVADQFEGRYTLTHTRHVLDQDGYRTHFVVSGRQERSLLGLATMGATSGASDTGHRIPGVVVAIVTGNDDPQKLGRVKLRFPWLSDGYESTWASTVQLAAGPNSGGLFLPEVGDEVLVAFEFGHVDHPFVVGGLHNGVDAPANVDGLFDNGKVKRREFTSRAGHKLTFFDDPSTTGFEVVTAKGLTIHLDDAANSITITGDNVTIEAKSNLILKAGTNIDIKASGSGSLQSGSTMTIKGATVNIN